MADWLGVATAPVAVAAVAGGIDTGPYALVTDGGVYALTGQTVTIAPSPSGVFVVPAATWPSGIPHCITQETFGSGVGNGLLRTDPDMGPPKVRRRFTAVTRPLVGTIVMTYAQLEALETFIAD